MTREEWDFVVAQIIPGCTFEYWANGGRVFCKPIAISSMELDLNHRDLLHKWPITLATKSDKRYLRFSNPRWPDGSPMLDGDFNAVSLKVKSLDLRFKNKTLPKTTMKPLALPR